MFENGDVGLLAKIGLILTLKFRKRHDSSIAYRPTGGAYTKRMSISSANPTRLEEKEHKKKRRKK